MSLGAESQFAPVHNKSWSIISNLQDSAFLLLFAGAYLVYLFSHDTHTIITIAFCCASICLAWIFSHDTHFTQHCMKGSWDTFCLAFPRYDRHHNYDCIASQRRGSYFALAGLFLSFYTLGGVRSEEGKGLCCIGLVFS